MIGWIVAWGRDEDHPDYVRMFPAHGEIIALPAPDLALVRVHDPDDEEEPGIHIIVRLTDDGLRFFRSGSDWAAWWDYVERKHMEKESAT